MERSTWNHLNSIAKWNPDFVETIYRFALVGHTNAEIARALDIHINTLRFWVSKYPAVKDALWRGREETRAYLSDLAEKGGFDLGPGCHICGVPPES